MNKAQVIDGVQQKTGLNRAAAERAVNAIIEVISNGLRAESNVQITGFGTFKVKERKARTGRNPQTGESMFIAASKSVGFKPGKKLKSSL